MIFSGVGPQALLAGAVQDFAEQVPGLRDGDERAIHQARVSIRRLREAVALAKSEFDEDEFGVVESKLVQFFRVLGKARDADTAQQLVQHVESRFPLAPATLGQLRASVNRSRLAARRKIVKTLEALEMHDLEQQLKRARRTRGRLVPLGESWRTTLRTHIRFRAGDARLAIDRAGGVYFRRRSHDARVAIKQLRYAIELGEAAGEWHDRKALRTLRKAQEALGQAHDREVLLERLRTMAAEGTPINSDELQTFEHFIDGEIAALHAKYVAMRPEILDVCARGEATARPRALKVGAVAAAMLAIPAVIARRRA